MAEFPPEFWESLRRVRSSGDQRVRDVLWMPTDDVYPFREYERDSRSRAVGGGRHTRRRVAGLIRALRSEGQREPVSLLWDPQSWGNLLGHNTSLSGMFLGEGNHRLAASRRMGRPFILTEIARSSAYANPEIKPDNVTRTVEWTGKPGPGNYYPSYPDPDDFPEFRGKVIRPNGSVGSPDDRAIVKALGNQAAAKRILGAMTKAGKVFGPAAGAIGLVAGLNDPAEALGATVEKAGDTRWARKQMTPAMKRQERKYYADKRAKQRASNPLTALLDNRARVEKLKKKGRA